jgi:hypothetical protein
MSSNKPIINMPNPNEEFEIVKGDGRLYGGEDGQTLLHTGQMCATQEWIPRPRITIHVQNFGAIELASTNVTKLELGENLFSAKQLTPTKFTEKDSVFQISGVKIGTPDRLFKLISHVFNFPIFDTDSVNNLHDSQFRMTLEFDGFQVELDTVNSNSNQVESSVAKGVILTHVICVTRKDGKEFNFSRVEKLIETLRFFLSFVRGGWVSVGHSHGLGHNEQLCFEAWDVETVTPGQIIWQWMPHTRPQDVKNTWESFSSRFNDDNFNEILRVAIDFYIQANTAIEPNTRLVLAMIALEALTDTINGVNEWVSHDKFEKLPNADRIRLMLVWAGVDIKYLGCVYNAFNTADKKIPTNWTNGPAITADLRNWTVHTTLVNRNKLKIIPRMAIYHAAQLSIWHLELVLLRLIGYNGQYRKRTQANFISNREYEQVPWAK